MKQNYTKPQHYTTNMKLPVSSQQYLDFSDFIPFGIHSGQMRVLPGGDCPIMGEGFTAPVCVIVGENPSDPTGAVMQLNDVFFESVIQDSDGNFTGYDVFDSYIGAGPDCVSYNAECQIISGSITGNNSMTFTYKFTFNQDFEDVPPNTCPISIPTPPCNEYIIFENGQYDEWDTSNCPTY